VTIRQALIFGRRELAGSSETPLLDPSILLAHHLGWHRGQLILHEEKILETRDQEIYREMISRRKTGEPVAYILGYKEFMGLEFSVDPRVLIPRPDTETLVEGALAHIKNTPGPHRILDLCTGSGAIILSLAHFLGKDNHHYTGADLSPQALEVARKNGKKLGLDSVQWIESDLFSNLEGPFEVILTNPPYLSHQETDECLKKGWKEPAMALEGGEKGLELPLELLEQSVEKLSKNGYFMMEGADVQMDELKSAMSTLGFSRIGFLKDLAGFRRVITGIYGMV